MEMNSMDAGGCWMFLKNDLYVRGPIVQMWQVASCVFLKKNKMLEWW
jgi:hypothetical protein